MRYKLVSDFKSIDINKWIRFVENHPKGNIFQTPYIYETYQITEKFDPLVIIALNGDDDIIGLQVSVTKRIYNNSLGVLTAHSIVQGGPLILNEDKDVLDCILIEYNEKIKGKAIYTQFRNMWEWGQLKQIFAFNKMIYEDHLDILFDLKKGEEVLLKEMKRDRRKGINQAYNKGILVKKIDLENKEVLNETYLILKNVYQRIKLPIPSIDYFRNVKKKLGKNLLSLGLYVENELIAVRLVLCYKNLIYDWYAGAKDEFLSFRPNDVLPWEIMKWGIKDKFETFDFGGAGKPNIPYGVRDFKLKFGGELVNFGRFEIVHKPFLMKMAKTGLILKQKIS